MNWFGLVRNVKDEETRLRLGREFLALETIYQRSANPEDYHQFLGLIWQLPDVFNVKGKALVMREALEQKFDAVHARLPRRWRSSPPRMRRCSKAGRRTRRDGRRFSRGILRCSTARPSSSCCN